MCLLISHITIIYIYYCMYTYIYDSPWMIHPAVSLLLIDQHPLVMRLFFVDHPNSKKRWIRRLSYQGNLILPLEVRFAESTFYNLCHIGTQFLHWIFLIWSLYVSKATPETLHSWYKLHVFSQPWYGYLIQRASAKKDKVKPIVKVESFPSMLRLMVDILSKT